MMEDENGCSGTQSTEPFVEIDQVDGRTHGGAEPNLGTHGRSNACQPDRASFLASLIGLPWGWQDRNCWDFAAHVELELFNRRLPFVPVPEDVSKKWIIRAIDAHPERDSWQEIPEGPMGLVGAGDGALCLMGHQRGPAHIGVWLRPEGRVIHCSETSGVCFEAPMALRQQGWSMLRFYEPKISP